MYDSAYFSNKHQQLLTIGIPLDELQAEADLKECSCKRHCTWVAWHELIRMDDLLMFCLCLIIFDTLPLLVFSTPLTFSTIYKNDECVLSILHYKYPITFAMNIF